MGAVAEVLLQEFLNANRDVLIARCRSKVVERRAPRAAEQELRYGIPLFLDQLIEALHREDAGAAGSPDIGQAAAQHGSELLRRGFTVGQVVHDYGDLCQAITEVAIEQDAAISSKDFHSLNRCLDNAIAGAVTEFGRQHEGATNERLGFLAHELRNHVNVAILAVTTIKLGHVGLGGATGALLDRTLLALRDLVDRALVDVRLTAGLSPRRERIPVAAFIADPQVIAAIEARTRDVELIVGPIEQGLTIEGDPQILAAAVANLLQNAVKFTRPRSRVSLSAYAAGDRVLIDVADECGGLPEGKIETIFQPFEQVSGDRSGLGLGLSISRRAVQANGGTLVVRNLPGTGCIFTINLPRPPPLHP